MHVSSAAPLHKLAGNGARHQTCIELWSLSAVLWCTLSGITVNRQAFRSHQLPVSRQVKCCRAQLPRAGLDRAVALTPHSCLPKNPAEYVRCAVLWCLGASWIGHSKMHLMQCQSCGNFACVRPTWVAGKACYSTLSRSASKRAKPKRAALLACSALRRYQLSGESELTNFGWSRTAWQAGLQPTSEQACAFLTNSKQYPAERLTQAVHHRGSITFWL